MTFAVRSDCGLFKYGRPVAHFSKSSEAVAEAKRLKKKGERAWVEDQNRRLVWGTAIRPTRDRVVQQEWWIMCHPDLRAKR